VNIAIFGLGYVGLAAAACFLRDGHNVYGVDVDESKVSMLNSGRCPISEPGLGELLAEGVASGSFFATNSAEVAVENTDFGFVCVGTPSAPNGSHDMRYIESVSKDIALAIKSVCEGRMYSVAYRSTMQPGSLEGVILPLFDASGVRTGVDFELFYNPEFLRESTAIYDFYNPPKIVVGRRCETVSVSELRELYRHVDCEEWFIVGYKESELTKFVDNSFHALKVAFANEIGRVCVAADIDVRVVNNIFLSDTKLNISPYYLKPGNAFGGSCLPKDVRALTAFASCYGLKLGVLSNVMNSNEEHKRFLIDRILGLVEPRDRILFYGLSFKAKTDDLRESPQVDIVEALLGKGYRVSILDDDVRADELIGKNASYVKAKLPHLAELLVEGESVDVEDFALIVKSKSIRDGFDSRSVRVLDIERL